MTIKNQQAKVTNGAAESAPNDRVSNSAFVGQGLNVRRGEKANPVFLPVTFRPIQTTDVQPGGRSRALNRFLSVMINKRAPGLWAGVVGGPKSKVEHLAELTVDNGLEADIAAVFSDVELMRKINDKLIRGNARHKAGVFTVDYLSLLRAVAYAVGASPTVKDAKWVVARIVTELLARAYTKLNVMVPFVGSAELSWHMRPIAMLDDLIHSSQVATINEVFEAIELGAAFDGAKEFNPAVSEAMIGPLLTAAANRIMNSLRYTKYMRDTAALVGTKLVNPSLLPEHLQDNADLDFLATNASFAIGAIAHAHDPISTPAFDQRDAIQYTVMRLREMKQFETWSMERFASHYSIELVKARSGYVAGVMVQRHDNFKTSGQVTRFVERADVVVQLPSAVGEAYISPLVEAVNRAFEGGILNKTVSVAAQHVITTTWESDGSQEGGHAFYFGVTADEEMMLGLAHAEFLSLGGIDDEGLMTPQIYMEVPDLKMFYESRGVPTGGGIMTSDPAEVLILRGLEKNDPAPFPLRPQVILDDVRRVVLSQLPATFTVDGLEATGLLEMSKPVRIKLAMLGDTPVQRLESIQDILGLTEVGELHLTVEQSMYQLISSTFASLVAVHDLLQQHGDAGRMLARQVAVAMHALVARLASHSAFVPLLRTMMMRFVHDPIFKGRHSALRAHLQEAYVKHQLGLSAAFMVMLKLGLLEFGVHEDVTRIFDDQNVVEIAVTSESWQDVLNTR